METTPLTQLGRIATPADTPEQAVLERVPNPQADTLYLARFTAPEFTSLCPVTGQPDFAHLVIDYVPEAWLVESKSLKLFLGTFRNHGSFHEDCTIGIARRLHIVVGIEQNLRLAIFGGTSGNNRRRTTLGLGRRSSDVDEIKDTGLCEELLHCLGTGSKIGFIKGLPGNARNPDQLFQSFDVLLE